MGFVKRILCKIDHFIIDLVSSFLIDSILNTSRHICLGISVNKNLTLFLHHVAFFLGHRTTQQITSAQSISRQITHDLHNLFLVDDTSVCRFQNRFQLRTVVCDGRGIILPLDILRDKIHRTRTVQRNAGYDILQTVRLQFLHEVLHPCALKLEDSIRLSGSYIIHYFLIVVIDFFHVQIRLFAAHHIYRILDYCQRAKTEKVHLQKS